MPSNRLFRFGSVALATLSVACAHGFKVNQYKTNESLFTAARREFDRHKWDHAVTAFEKLTLELPARDTLLPLAHWYLAKAYAGRREHLLAAQAYNRLAESFATDTLADDALFEAAREYQRMWRKPQLDPQYGDQALSGYQTLLGLYPDTDLKDRATKEMERLQEWFAAKDYESGMYYFRRKAFDSAIIYFKDVVKTYPQTDKSREAYLRLAESFEAIRYREDKREVCATLTSKYPADKEVATVCAGPPTTVTQQAKPDTVVRPDSL
jgi:outer membrane protein assembly factor BamD